MVRAANYYTKSSDGLAQEWRGRVFMNPPYSMPLVGEFISKLEEEIDSDRVAEAIVLVNNCTDTKWFHALLGRSSLVCFTRGRLKFWRPDRDVFAARQGQALFYVGPNKSSFAREFSDIGAILTIGPE